MLGGIVALYANGREEQNIYILTGGIVLLMLGIYRVSRTVPSKSEKEEPSFIREEKIEEE